MAKEENLRKLGSLENCGTHLKRTNGYHRSFLAFAVSNGLTKSVNVQSKLGLKAVQIMRESDIPLL